MVDPILLSRTIIYSSLLTLLSLGLTLTYLTTKVPNFAHASFSTVGVYVIRTLTAEVFLGGNVYNYLIIAFIFGGAVALIQYLLILRPLIRRGASIIALMITTLAVDFILVALMNIFADYLSHTFQIRSRYFLLTTSDIKIAGQNGILIIAPALIIVVVSVLYLALTRTTFGIAMRAAIEDSSLASVVGINVNLVYSVSWFIAGALAGLSGGLIPLYIPGNPDIGTQLLLSMFAASTVGGLFNIYGAVVGGFLIGFAEILGTTYISSIVGPWVIAYRQIVPLIAIAITLLLSPRGILGADWKKALRSVRSIIYKPKN